MNKKQEMIKLKEFTDVFSECAILNFNKKEVWIMSKGKLVVSDEPKHFDLMIERLMEWKNEKRE